jgi:asparagine synthase (glutamine-hydrolysing)
MAERWWSWLPQSLRNGLGKVTSHMDQRKPLSRRLAKWFSGASLEGDARLVNYFRWIGRNDLEALYYADFWKELGGRLPSSQCWTF